MGARQQKLRKPTGKKRPPSSHAQLSAAHQLFRHARQAAQLTQDELAIRAGTSRPTLSAYEHGRISPSLDTAARLFAVTGHEITVQPAIEFTYVPYHGGHTCAVPSALPRLTPQACFRTVRLPLHLNWSYSQQDFNLADRRQRARVYTLVLTEGTPEDILTYIDGALLADMWDELILPAAIRTAWQPLIDSAYTTSQTPQRNR